MSIDHHFYVPAGMRNHPERRFSDNKFWSLASMREAGHEATKHQVFLAHGAAEDAIIAVDEQFYFENAEDARWFFAEGHKRMLYQGESRPDRMNIWIDGKEACEHCGTPFEGEKFEVHCETCGMPLTLCEDCWNDSDDCPACEEKREREVWCPLCDTPLMGMPSEEKQRHYDGHRDKK